MKLSSKAKKTPDPRRIVLIHPRFQGRGALAFALILLLGAAILTVFLYHNSREALLDASTKGHFGDDLSPYFVVKGILTRELVVLFLGVVVASAALLQLLSVRISRGILGVTASLEASCRGDLSTPTASPGPREFGEFGDLLDLRVRKKAREILLAAREEAHFLAGSSLPPDEFDRRLEEFVRSLKRIAP